MAYEIPAPASDKQEMILNNDAQILVIGGAAGSGKSYLLQLIPLRYINDPNTTVIMFRRTTPQIKGQGGLFDTARSIYTNLPPSARPKIKDSTMDMRWPSGATQKYTHMEYVKDKFNHQGLQYTLVGFDEGTQFEWEQIEYLMSRLRSASSHKSRMVISCNPDPDHKLRELIDWHLDEDGYPIPERDGVVRYFYRYDGDFIFGETQKELADKFDIAEKDWDAKLLSFSFISANIYDNPPMLKNNPEYLAFLEGLGPVDKAQLLHGNWNVKAEGANYFKRENLVRVDRLPDSITWARGWDKASQAPTTQEKHPDYTACTKMGKSSDGLYYIVGDFIDDNSDDLTDTYGRFRKRVGERDRVIIKQAEHDGEDCTVVLPIDPGAAGKVEYQESAKRILSEGFRCQPDPAPSNKNKLARFAPFADAVEAGLVRIVESTFPNKQSLNKWYDELEKFDGERSTRIKKDDWVDSTATVFNFLTMARSIKIVRRNQKRQDTFAKDVVSRK